MIYGIGTDIIEIKRIKKAVERHPDFLHRYFTQMENDYFLIKKNSPQSIAGYFAAKEAVSKAFGTGFSQFKFKDIEIKKDTFNKPCINLYGNAKKIAIEKNIETIHVSLSHCKEYAIAYVVAITEEGLV